MAMAVHPVWTEERPFECPLGLPKIAYLTLKRVNSQMKGSKTYKPIKCKFHESVRHHSLENH